MIASTGLLTTCPAQRSLLNLTRRMISQPSTLVKTCMDHGKLICVEFFEKFKNEKSLESLDSCIMRKNYFKTIFF